MTKYFALNSKNLLIGGLTILVLIILLLSFSKINGLFSKPVNQTQENFKFERNLKPEEKKALNLINANSSAKDQQDYKNTVASAAKESDVLEIKNCQGNPPIYKFPAGKKFKVRNADPKLITLSIAGKRFNFNSGETREIDLYFINANGYASYRCNNSETPAGMVYAVK